MRKFLVVVAVASLTFVPFSARASNVTEVPDVGSEQMARGGAWVARASDPLATIFNPAGLAGQPSRITLQNNFLFHHTCFTRLRAANDTTDDQAAVDASGHYPRVCNDIEPQLSPQFAATLHVSDRLGLGFAVVGPSTPGTKTFPDFVPDGAGNPMPAPNRYLLVKQSAVILSPTIGIGYEVIDNLRLGASFSWGIAHVKSANTVAAINSDALPPERNDLRANLQVQDLFVPAFNLGAIYSLTPKIDIAGWYKWSDAIRARGDVGTAANYYSRRNGGGDDSNVSYGDTIYEDCGTGLKTTACGGGGNATLKFVIPMEAKLGARFHVPRRERPEWANAPGDHLRDPLTTDLFDIEANLTWANNSALDSFQVRFPSDATGKGVLPVAGITGGEIPPSADQPRSYKDVFGIRVGGDYNILPDQLALRGGAFFESSAANPQYQTIDFAPSARVGFALGGTYRIRFGSGDRSSALELMVGYGHVFFADQKREDPNADGIRAVAGTSCNNSDAVDTAKCSDGSPRYRTKWPVNLGTITNALNVINVGLAYRF